MGRLFSISSLQACPTRSSRRNRGIGLSGARFEISAERIGTDISHGGDLLQLYRPFEVVEGCIVDEVYPLMPGLGKMMFKTGGCQRLQFIRTCQDVAAPPSAGEDGASLPIAEAVPKPGYLDPRAPLLPAILFRPFPTRTLAGNSPAGQEKAGPRSFHQNVRRVRPRRNPRQSASSEGGGHPRGRHLRTRTGGYYPPRTGRPFLFQNGSIPLPYENATGR